MKSEDIVDLGMVDARYLRMYNSCYGDDSPNGKLMYRAQRECFENEKMGTLMNDATMKLLVCDNDVEYPILGSGTTEADWKEAQYVMSLNACTILDLERWRMTESDFDESVGTGDGKQCSVISEQAVMSQEAERLKKGLELSMHDPEEGVNKLCIEKEKTEHYN